MCLPQFTGITCNSKKVKPGYAFVAIKGFKHDGNRYIKEACQRGARVIFTENPPRENLPVPVIKVENARRTLAELLCRHYGHPSKKILVCGITGTNGKTTSTNLLYHLYRHKGGKCGLIGTVGTKLDKEIIPPGLTTPDAEQLQKYLSCMVQKGTELAVMEVSSHGIKLDRIWGIDFDLAVITNITRDHFDLHSSFEEYLQTKKQFLTGLKKDAIAFINVDDPHLVNLRSKLNSRHISFGIKNKNQADAWLTKIKYSPNETRFQVKIKKRLPGLKNDIEPVEFEGFLKTPGIHNLYNALPALLAGLSLGIPVPDIQKGLATFPGVWRRMQVIYRGDFTTIDDCAHNPGSYSAVFTAISKFDFKRLLIVNAIRGNRGIKINIENARTIAENVKKYPDSTLIITSCMDVAKKDDYVSPDEEEAFLSIFEEQSLPFSFYNDLDPALEHIINEAKPGDLILLLGAHAMDGAAPRFIEKLKEKMGSKLRPESISISREEGCLSNVMQI